MGIAGKWGWTSKLQLNANPNFSSGWTSKHRLLYKISTINFNLATVPGRRNSIIPPAAIPGRCVQAYWTHSTIQTDIDDNCIPLYQNANLLDTEIFCA
jgi:hypothetical protein